ncbi:unnamed protein product [Eruca vesicaria subsp. sativa]|uniref:Uncharacterized protein n=1 Tax=Eruca vesicaria subsp. sativa TaxID=29727 RepID=A0ABC8LGM9_ERUVS|nr:unnamed protein product [Eruca vesicaria subsp. sativa]
MQTPLLLTFQLPQWMLEPNGETWPPHKIQTNADWDMMMTVHEGDVEPNICVIFGAEEVATFHFRCRSPFTIGTLTFLGEGVTEEEHMALVLDIIRGNEILCSDRMLNHIFNQNEMVLLYRFSLEIEKAKNSLDLNLRPNLKTDDHIVHNIGNNNVDTHVQNVPDVANLEGATHISGPNVPYHASPTLVNQAFNGGREVPQGVHHTGCQPPFYTPPWNTINVRPWYWENLMSSSYAMELQQIYGVRGSEYVGYTTNDLNIGNTNAARHMHGYPIHEPRTSYLIPIEVSSMASSTEMKCVTERLDDISRPQIKGFPGEVYQEKGESSSGRLTTQPDVVGKVEEGNFQDGKDNDGPKNAGGDA